MILHTPGPPDHVSLQNGALVLSSGGEGAPLIGARSGVRVPEGPTVVPHPRIKAFLATRSGPSCVEENVFIARKRDLTCFLPRSAGPRVVRRGWVCRVPKTSECWDRSPE